MPVIRRIPACGVVLQLPFDVIQKSARPEAKQFCFIHGVPSSSFINANHSVDCFAVRIPPAGLKPTAIPVSWAYSRMARVITNPTGRVALIDSLPVEVLMKSAPAIIATKLARATLRNVDQVARPQDRLHVAVSRGLLEFSHLIVSSCHLPPNT